MILDRCKRLFKLWFVIAMLFCSPLLQANEIPLIAAAASVKFALQDIAAAFTKDTGKKVRISFGSSGNLTRQIQQGAPFQLFFSANAQYVQQLRQQQLTQDQGTVYALGRLVLLTTKNAPLTLDDQLQGLKQTLLNKQLQRFAIANPEHAPYGVAAREALQHQELWDLIQPNLILGENVAQAAQFAGSGAAQGGLVSYSLALVPALKNKTHSILIPQEFHQPLEQTMVLLNNAGETAKQFYHYLQQDKARSMLSHYGFEID